MVHMLLHACSFLLYACSFLLYTCSFLLHACPSPFALCMLLSLLHACSYRCSMHAPLAAPCTRTFAPTCCITPLHSPLRIGLPCVGQSDQRTAATSSSVLRKPTHNSSLRDFRWCSLSPDHPAPLQRSFPSDKASASSRRPEFQPGTGGRVYSACAVCLGHHPHRVINCTAMMLWDGSLPALSTRSNKILVIRDGRALCADWQCASGCPTTRNDNRHICSGCASTAHGAQECPQAQKVSSSNSL